MVGSTTATLHLAAKEDSRPHRANWLIKFCMTLCRNSGYRLLCIDSRHRQERESNESSSSSSSLFLLLLRRGIEQKHQAIDWCFSSFTLTRRVGRSVRECERETTSKLAL